MDWRKNERGIGIENAIRFSVSNAGSATSRQVAEQRVIEALGGIGNAPLRNALNPIGQARQDLLAVPGLGDITGAAVPNLLGSSGGAALGGAIGAGINLSQGK
jgi:hypothetical protein